MGRLAKGDELGMGGGVAVGLAPVVGAGHHLPVADDDGADGHLALIGRSPGLVEGEPHAELVEVTALGAGLLALLATLAHGASPRPSSQICC